MGDEIQVRGLEGSSQFCHLESYRENFPQTI